MSVSLLHVCSFAQSTKYLRHQRNQRSKSLEDIQEQVISLAAISSLMTNCLNPIGDQDDLYADPYLVISRIIAIFASIPWIFSYLPMLYDFIQLCSVSAPVQWLLFSLGVCIVIALIAIPFSAYTVDFCYTFFVTKNKQTNQMNGRNILIYFSAFLLCLGYAIPTFNSMFLSLGGDIFSLINAAILGILGLWFGTGYIAYPVVELLKQRKNKEVVFDRLDYLLMLSFALGSAAVYYFLAIYKNALCIQFNDFNTVAHIPWHDYFSLTGYSYLFVLLMVVFIPLTVIFIRKGKHLTTNEESASLDYPDFRGVSESSIRTDVSDEGENSQVNENNQSQDANPCDLPFGLSCFYFVFGGLAAAAAGYGIACSVNANEVTSETWCGIIYASIVVASIVSVYASKSIKSIENKELAEKKAKCLCF